MTTTKRLYLIRHGDKVKSNGAPLSELGIAQAKITAHHLKSFPIQKIYSSPILRAQQTAKHISTILNIEVKTNNLLMERANWGDEPSQSFEDFVSMWKRAFIERDWQPPIGDSSRASSMRIQKFIESKTEHSEQSVVVTHGGIITDFLLNVFEEKTLNDAFPQFTDNLLSGIRECSITTVEYSPENLYKLIDLANTNHLKIS